MKNLSVLIPTKNSEDTLERAIKSIKDIAFEILVVDSGSTDKTVEIAKNLGAKVLFREWKNYGEQCNFLIEQANGEFLFVLDADEEVSLKLQNSIKKVLESEKTADCYKVNRKTFYMGKFLNYVWQPEWRIRLFKKGKIKFEERVHAKAICTCDAEKLEGELYHYSFKNLRHHINKSIKFAESMAEYMYQNHKKFKTYKLIINPTWYFIKYFFLKKGFLDGFRGFIACCIGAFYVFLKYSFLLEIELKKMYGENLWKR